MYRLAMVATVVASANVAGLIPAFAWERSGEEDD
jgi:hypothetical protein